MYVAVFQPGSGHGLPLRRMTNRIATSLRIPGRRRREPAGRRCSSSTCACLRLGCMVRGLVDWGRIVGFVGVPFAFQNASLVWAGGRRTAFAVLILHHIRRPLVHQFWGAVLWLMPHVVGSIRAHGRRRNGKIERPAGHHSARLDWPLPAAHLARRSGAYTAAVSLIHPAGVKLSFTLVLKPLSEVLPQSPRNRTAKKPPFKTGNGNHDEKHRCCEGGRCAGRTVRDHYLESLKLVERLHRRLLDVIKDEFDRRGRSDVNSVQALLLYNIGDDKELTAGELRTRGY